MSSGGCIFLDHASGYIHIEMQFHLNTYVTLNTKISFKCFCLNAEFKEGFKEFLQHASQLAPGAHHRNEITIARTMLIHKNTHWPHVSTNVLRPLAVLHAIHLVNQIPYPRLGQSPFELFSKIRFDHGDLDHIHVWGFILYVKSPSLLKGVKTSCWQTRSKIFAYLGLSDTHSKTYLGVHSLNWLNNHQMECCF